MRGNRYNRVNRWVPGQPLFQKLLNRHADRVNQISAERVADNTYKPLGRSSTTKANWWAKITECDKTTGFAKVKKCEGEIGSLTIITGTPEVIVFLGIEPFGRMGDGVDEETGDECLCVWNGKGITPEWTAHVPIVGICHTEPDEDTELSDVQDDGGGLCTTCCTDSVEPP